MKTLEDMEERLDGIEAHLDKFEHEKTIYIPRATVASEFGYLTKSLRTVMAELKRHREAVEHYRDVINWTTEIQELGWQREALRKGEAILSGEKAAKL